MTTQTSYITLNADNFQQEVMESKEPVLVDFWADWCGPCHMIAPAIEALTEEYEGRIKIGKLDVDQHSELAAQYGIRSIPTILFFKENEIVDRTMGAVSKQEIEDKIKCML